MTESAAPVPEIAPVPETVKAALERAARYRFLAALLEPPRPGRRAALRALAMEVRAPAGLDLAPALAPDDEAAAAEHFRVLCPAGRVSACASDHVQGGFADKGPILGDIAGFYEAFGFTPALREAPDHFSNLLSFLAILAMKEAYAAFEGNADQVEVARDAEEKLLAAHVRPHAAAFAERLAAEAPPGGVFATVAECVRGLAPLRTLQDAPHT